jgi:hypothetical protein
LGKITEEEKRLILEWENNWRIELENAGPPTIEEVDNPDYSPPPSPPRTFRIYSEKTISNEKYYLLEQIKEGLREWTEAQIEVPPQ